MIAVVAGLIRCELHTKHLGLSIYAQPYFALKGVFEVEHYLGFFEMNL